MGKWFAAESKYEPKILASVNNVGEDEDIDVFVSHRSDDENKAMEVAHCVKTHGLTAWVDAIDMKGMDDDEKMVGRIEDAISRASSLIAVITGVTNESWWVPFEIGLAYEKEKQLASYCEDTTRVEFPTFLWSWPLVRDHCGLYKWCEHIKATKTTGHRVLMEASKAAIAKRRQRYMSSLFDIRSQLRNVSTTARRRTRYSPPL